MRFVYHPSIDTLGDDCDDLIDKDNGNITVASDVEEEYQGLLEAAPDLLEACKFYLYQYDSSHHGVDKGETPRRIRAAIAKAEGRGA